MIFYIPEDTTLENPYIPNFSAIDTAQLPLEVLHIRGSGTCYLRLPAISTLPLYHTKVLITGESEDAVINVLPFAGDYISFHTALVDSDHVGTITGNKSVMELTTVMEYGFNGDNVTSASALWYSPNPSTQDTVYPLYVFGTQDIDFAHSGDGDNWLVTFNPSLNNLNKSSVSQFVELDWNISFWNGGTDPSTGWTNEGNRSILSQSISGHGAGTYICNAGYFYSDINGNIVYIQIVSFITVNALGAITRRMDLSGVYPSTINSSNLFSVTIVVAVSSATLPTITWVNYGAPTPNIGTGDSLSYTVPSGSPALIIAHPTIQASEWPNIFNYVDTGGDNSLLLFRIIPA